MKRNAALAAIAVAVGASPAFSQAKNVILFIGDGAGVSSLNAASIYEYGKPQALSIQKWPNLALVDTSTAKEWVTDSAASMSAIMTGHKGRNTVVSMSPDADNEVYKTLMEYAMEKGLSTGLISNAEKTGVFAGCMVPFYSHSNSKTSAVTIFDQALNPKFGKGPDFLLGPNRKFITAAWETAGRGNLQGTIAAKGYAYPDTMAALALLPPDKGRVFAFLNEDDFDVTQAVQQAVARLSKNPRGYFLAVHSDCHLAKSRPSIERVVALDRAIASVADRAKNDTLLLFMADHGYDLRIKGEHLTDARKMEDHKKILSVVSLEDEHTAEEVALLATGPGSDRVKGYMDNTDVFHVLMQNYGWEKPVATTAATRAR